MQYFSVEAEVLPFHSVLKYIDFSISTDVQNQAGLLGCAEDDLIFAG